jgi:hypothetical protein
VHTDRRIADEQDGMLIWIVLLMNWAGSVVIPLDWNRDWQKWPVPNCISGASSLIVFHLFSQTVKSFKPNKSD